MEFESERRAVAAMMRRLYRRRLTTATGGNISLRVAGDRVAITGSAGDKARIRAKEVAVLALDGTSLTPDVQHSTEYQMHLRVYQTCERVQAIIHAHPVTATTFSAAETPIDCELIAEAYAILGRPVVVPYALTGTGALADLAAEAARTADCLLLENHGVTTLGCTLLEAFARLETLEAAAQQTLIARQLEGVHRLTAEQRRELDELYGRRADQ